MKPRNVARLLRLVDTTVGSIKNPHHRHAKHHMLLMAVLDAIETWHDVPPMEEDEEEALVQLIIEEIKLH